MHTIVIHKNSIPRNFPSHRYNMHVHDTIVRTYMHETINGNAKLLCIAIIIDVPLIVAVKHLTD